MYNASLAEIAERGELGYGLKWVMVDWGAQMGLRLVTKRRVIGRH